MTGGVLTDMLTPIVQDKLVVLVPNKYASVLTTTAIAQMMGNNFTLNVASQNGTMPADNAIRLEGGNTFDFGGIFKHHNHIERCIGLAGKFDERL